MGRFTTPWTVIYLFSWTSQKKICNRYRNILFSGQVFRIQFERFFITFKGANQFDMLYTYYVRKARVRMHWPYLHQSHQSSSHSFYYYNGNSTHVGRRDMYVRTCICNYRNKILNVHCDMLVHSQIHLFHFVKWFFKYTQLYRLHV